MYLKAIINGEEHHIYIEDDKIFAICKECQDEIKINAEILIDMLQHGATFEGIKLTCSECASGKGA